MLLTVNVREVPPLTVCHNASPLFPPRSRTSFGAFGGKFVIRPPWPSEPKKAFERELGTSGYAASPAADPPTVELV